MADNVAVTPGTGATIATDEVGGFHFQRIKPTFGTDGVATDVSATNPLPIVQIGATPAGTANIGDVDVLTVPADPFGANADAASVSGSVSAKLKAIATALGTTALDLGAGTGGTRTLRVAIDSAQLDGAEMEWVDVSQTNVALGTSGAAGDYLNHLVIVPGTTSPGPVDVKDGSAGTARRIFAGGATSVPTLAPIDVNFGAVTTSNGWFITTGANVTVFCFGNFT